MPLAPATNVHRQNRVNAARPPGDSMLSSVIGLSSGLMCVPFHGSSRRERACRYVRQNTGAFNLISARASRGSCRISHSTRAVADRPDNDQQPVFRCAELVGYDHGAPGEAERSTGRLQRRTEPAREKPMTAGKSMAAKKSMPVDRASCGRFRRSKQSSGGGTTSARPPARRPQQKTRRLELHC